MELRSEVDSEIPPVPWLDFIGIDILSFLVALGIAILVSMECEPGDILSVAGIFIVLCRSSRIEEVYRESELVFAVSRWCAESISTFSEVPHTLLVGSTSIPADDDEGITELFLEISRHLPESFTSFLPQIDDSPSFTDRIDSPHLYEIRRCIFSI